MIKVYVEMEHINLSPRKLPKIFGNTTGEVKSRDGLPPGTTFDSTDSTNYQAMIGRPISSCLHTCCVHRWKLQEEPPF